MDKQYSEMSDVELIKAGVASDDILAVALAERLSIMLMDLQAAGITPSTYLAGGGGLTRWL